MPNAIFSASGIDFQYVTNFTQVWNSVNNYYPGCAPGSFWEAQCPDSTFNPFGTLCVPQTADPSGATYMLVARVTPGNNASMPPLAPPTGWTMVWNDHNTGNRGSDAVCWQMIPPPNYVALGTVVTQTYQQPPLASYWCIRQDLVAQLGQAVSIWTDQKTGATTSNLLCYGVGPIGVPSGSAGPGVQTPTGAWALDAGSFLTANNYNLPSAPLNVILLPSVGRLHAAPASPPQLTPYVNVAPASAMSKVASMDVLFPMISDPARPMAQQIANPVYTIEIWGQWTNIGAEAAEGTSGAISQQIQTGIQTQQSEQWSNQLGVSVSVSDSFGVKFFSARNKLTLGASVSYSHTWAGSQGQITSTSTTIGVTANVPAYTYVVLWQLNYTSYLRRQDGTYVGAMNGSQYNGYSLSMGTKNYVAGTVPYDSTKSVAIGGSTAFAVYLRMDGNGVTQSTASGGGVVNCQYTPPGAWEKFQLVQQADSTFVIQSVSFPNVYLRMDGSTVTQYTNGGGGIVNCQLGPGKYERFNLVPQGDGTVAIGSVHFPGVYLRIDGTGVSQFLPGGGGTVNCQFGVAAYEKLTIVLA